jgi:DNA-binding GntR family transcriptional regulator
VVGGAAEPDVARAHVRRVVWFAMGRHEARTEAEEAIGRRIACGQLDGGAHVDETALAGDLGVDDGTVREALCGLERDGYVRAQGDGYVVSTLDESELREAYPIVLLLEGLAVRTTQRFDAGTVARLRELNAAMRAVADDPVEVAWRDHDFHAELTRACGNEQLLGTLRPLKRMLLRYEVGYMGSAERVERSVAQHDRLIEALERGDHEGAAALVEQNFRDSMPTLLERF